MRASLFAVVAGVVVVSAAASAASADDACVPSGTNLDSARVSAGAVELCGGQAPKRACWRVELATGAWSALPADASLATAHSEPRAESVHLCTPDGGKCLDAKPPKYDHDAVIAVAASADLSSVVLLQSGGMPTISILDVATWKPRATITPWKTAMTSDGMPAMFQNAHFVGSALEVLISASPVSESAKLFDVKSGKKIGSIGKLGTELDDIAPVQLDGNRWAFVTFEVTAVIVVDVTSGIILRTIPRPKATSGIMALGKLDAKHVVVVPGASSEPIYIADVDARTVKPIAFATCAPKP